MKRFLSIALLLTLILTACGGKTQNNNPADTSGDQNTPAQTDNSDNSGNSNNSDNSGNKTAPAPTANSKLVFSYQGCPLPMNAEFAPLLDYIGEPDSYFEAASCAFDGLDKTYTYGDIEIITYPDGDKDYISSVRLLGNSVSTPEGVTVGSSQEDVISAYGENYTAIGEQFAYEDGDTNLYILFQDGAAVSVEYAAINPLLG